MGPSRFRRLCIQSKQSSLSGAAHSNIMTPENWALNSEFKHIILHLSHWIFSQTRSYQCSPHIRSFAWCSDCPNDSFSHLFSSSKGLNPVPTTWSWKLNSKTNTMFLYSNHNELINLFAKSYRTTNTPFSTSRCWIRCKPAPTPTPKKNKLDDKIAESVLMSHDRNDEPFTRTIGCLYFRNSTSNPREIFHIFCICFSDLFDLQQWNNLQQTPQHPVYIQWAKS